MPSQRNNLAQLALRWVRSALAVATAALLLGLFASETQASILSPGITEIDASELLESHFLGVDALGEHLDQLSEPTEDEGMGSSQQNSLPPAEPQPREERPTEDHYAFLPSPGSSSSSSTTSTTSVGPGAGVSLAVLPAGAAEIEDDSKSERYAAECTLFLPEAPGTELLRPPRV